MNLLIVYYHPICFDLAESFLKLFKKITIAVNPKLKDNYGGFENVVQKVRENKQLENVECIALPIALQRLKSKQFDYVAVDGVFDGDALTIAVCEDKKVPYFCINGYPHNTDEPSKNILSFSHFLPQIQYKQRYPHEQPIKETDWRNICENGKSDGKNILVFYPELNYVKRFRIINKAPAIRDSIFCSFIHRYEECNKWNYKIFEQVKAIFGNIDYNIENYSKLEQNDVLQVMNRSLGLCHFKHGDCPGVSVLEALLLGIPVITMRSFVNASFNQEVLIDNFNAIIADDIDELINRMLVVCYTNRPRISATAIEYMDHLTSFDRQKDKLERFIHKCEI